MKNVIIATIAAFSFSAASAMAGGLAPVVAEEQPVVITEAPAQTGSLGQVIVPLLFVLLVGAALSNDSTTATDTTTAAE